MNIIIHIDMNSYFASVEQQANPRLRGKPIGITGGDRIKRTVLSTASIEAKKSGVKTGMQIWEAKKVCPEIIIVQSDHDKYLSVTTRFLNILKNFSPYLEVFSIDEAFLEIESSHETLATTAQEIKQKIKAELGSHITCSIGISYNKLMAKLAGSLQKPDGLVIIPDQETAIQVLDTIELDDICGIGQRTKQKLFNMGVINFKVLRQVPKECLISSFKSYGQVLYNMARGIDYSPLKPFYECEEVKSVGHRYTIDHDTSDLQEIRQILLKLCELVASRLRAKNLLGKTIHCWYRASFSHLSHLPDHNTPGVGLDSPGVNDHFGGVFMGDGMQKTLILPTNNGLEIFKTAWDIFYQIWSGDCRIRMVGVSVSNLKPQKPANISWLPGDKRQETILQAMDKINNKFGNFTLQRGSLLNSNTIERKPNPFLSDRRFKL